MGTRNDILKNLGIPEYPWSSDDEEQSADMRQAMPRATGLQPPAPSSSGVAPRSPPSNNLLFLSRLHSTWPRPASSSAGSINNNRVNAPYMSRTINAPPPEMLVRQVEERGNEDIRRVLAFRRLTRNMSGTLSRYSRHSGYTVPRSYSRPGNLVPTETNSWSNTDAPRRGNRMPPLDYTMPEEPEEVPSSHAVIYPLTLLNENPDEAPPVPEPETEVEAEVDSQGVANETAASGVAVEDAIVEISDEPEEPAVDLMAASEHNLQASSSRTDTVDAPESETQQMVVAQGVKRKRRSSSADRPTEPLTVKEFNQKILRLLECPVCLEWMEPPMSQCRRGHLVCSRCRARLASCPVCRTTFSSVRNRAMEGVAEMLRYPCRHGCGREVRLRRRAPHEASCAARKYACPAPLCQEKLHLARDELHAHIHANHMQLVKVGPRHRFGIKVNSEAHDNWLIVNAGEVFHMRVDVDIRTWGVIVYVAYIGPKCNAKEYAYEVSIDGQHNGRKMIYRRATHSDLESSSHNVSRQDCFHLSLDQALNFIRFKNRHCDAERILEFEVEVSKIQPPPTRDDSDS